MLRRRPARKTSHWCIIGMPQCSSGLPHVNAPGPKASHRLSRETVDCAVNRFSFQVEKRFGCAGGGRELLRANGADRRDQRHALRPRGDLRPRRTGPRTPLAQRIALQGSGQATRCLLFGGCRSLRRAPPHCVSCGCGAGPCAAAADIAAWCARPAAVLVLGDGGGDRDGERHLLRAGQLLFHQRPPPGLEGGRGAGVRDGASNASLSSRVE